MESPHVDNQICVNAIKMQILKCKHHVFFANPVVSHKQPTCRSQRGGARQL